MEQLLAEPSRWHGRIVRATGRMGACKPLTCHLLAVVPDGAVAPGKGRLSIGGTGPGFDDKVRKAFDEKAGGLRDEEVALVARFDAKCLTTHICTDRANMLQPSGAEALTLLKDH
ncbi:hypothetical protein [Sphingomonas sp.]|uniref:hypothetical protein n=1 Tax=Sphingomonas sp. TaxID=28214 RepID=UPI003B3B4B2C